MDCTVRVVFAAILSPLLVWFAYISLTHVAGTFVIEVIKKTLVEEDDYSSDRFRPLHVMLEGAFAKMIDSHIRTHRYGAEHYTLDDITAMAKAVCHDEMRKKGGK